MSYEVDPPFALGQTLGVSSATDGGNWVGVVKAFPDVNPTTGVIRSNRIKWCVAVRNTSGGALLPKRVVKFDTTAAGPSLFEEVKGYNATAGEDFVGVIDEHLPAGGVAANDVFWVTVKGPTEVSVALSGTDVAVGDKLTTVTAASAGATTAGRVAGTTATAGVIGRACSVGATTGSAVLAVVDTQY